MANGGIHQLVYSRHREWIFWASLVLICVIYTYSPFPILFLHYHSIGQPLRVENFLDSPCLFKFCYLIFDSIKMSLDEHRGGYFFGVIDGLTFKWWQMKFGFHPEAS